MNESTWQNAEVTPVLIDTGTFPNDQRRRYRPASFRLTQLNGAMYFETLGTAANELDAAQGDGGVADLQMRTGYGFMRDPVFVLDEAVGAGDDDTIFSVHRVDLL